MINEFGNMGASLAEQKFHHGQKSLVLKDSYLVYLNPNSSLIGWDKLEIFLF
jgi:hypothetical protein